ncbi:uncharacterized protein NECHADRAFT_87957 [Fusarium vanettenii 77-13-4]|uniref:Uncharacterized protein n=1 Tax=Fusarium vanettenii (strain ATCC MYA-4622 / CBS 123669 / FGSC 9596 / NRRL 45880 / 77-13-4) TaxID=660122 RepID=C7ZJW4_FUSV7|nr:uncharacterized protein NECHADRAFT_87957 [Fusarium vanettenii 77-13-4]EEU35703.1 predicted protein [Fusarium vanettenii 77-13-4]
MGEVSGETHGWTENKFKDVRARGNKWLALCKFSDTRSGLSVSPGLLCFFLMGDNPFGIHRDDYLSIQDETQQRVFVDLLELNNYTTALFAAGNAYVGTFDGSTSVRFRFEQERREIDWQNQDQDEIISLLSVLDEEDQEVMHGEVIGEEEDDEEEDDEEEDEEEEDDRKGGE